MTRAEIHRLLIAAVAERDHRVTGDGHVTERVAADLLAVSPHTLRHWRATHRPIPFRRLGGRVQYALHDLAAFFLASEQTREDAAEADRCRLDAGGARTEHAPVLPRQASR